MKLSIITINYNNKAGLEKTVASVMSQTWRDFEWIIIDGDSTDGSKEVIEELAKNPNANISYWCSEPDKGIYNAMNKGIAKASGEYLNFMNSGDCYYKCNTLNKVLVFLVDNSIYYGDSCYYANNKLHIYHVGKIIDISLLYERNFCHQAIFYPISALRNCKYDESYKIVADYAMNVLLAMKGFSFTFVNEIICNYDFTGISTQNSQKKDEEIYRIQRELFPICVKRVIEELNSYKKGHVYRRLQYLLDNSKLRSYIIRIFLKIMSK